MALKLKNNISASFKMHGLTLRSDACKYLCQALSSVEAGQLDECLERLIDTIQKQPLHSSMVSREMCEEAVQECNAQQEDSDQIFSVIDAFEVPQLVYNHERKKFILSSEVGIPPPVLFGDAEAKARLFRERFTVLQQRTARHELFSPATIASSRSESDKKFRLKPVEFLLGSSAKLEEIIVLGMLTQLKEGKWYLEDNTGAVQLDLSRANFHTGLFTENCFVLAEGWYEDVFHVNAFGFPPPEPAKRTRGYFGNINFFGGPSSTCAKSSVRLKELEDENEDAMFVFLSDVWLDQVRVMEKLKTLFLGYSEMPPTCFVFCGNFLSTSYGGKNAKKLKELFTTLGEMIAEHPILAQKCQFLFVPGPQDPGPFAILPRPAIPQILWEDLARKVPSVIFATNPCRIQYCTQEIVIFREDLVMKMCRNCVRFPADGEIPTHFAKTILCQGHLCPLPLHVAPVYWPYDHALRLYPLPDLIVCADKYDSFSVSQTDSTIINPGSFPRSNFSFKVYLPGTKQVEDSQIED